MPTTPNPPAKRESPKAILRLLIWIALAPVVMLLSVAGVLTPLIILLPLPYALWFARGKDGRLALLPLILLFALFSVGSPYLLAWAAYFIVATLVLKQALAPGRPFFQCMAWGFFAFFSGVLSALFVLWSTLGDPVTAVMGLLSEQAAVAPPGSALEQTMRLLAQAEILLKDISTPPDVALSQALALPSAELQSKFLTLVEATVRAQLPTLIIRWTLGGGVICCAWGAWWLNRSKPGLLGLPAVKGPKLPPLRLWALPPSTGWAMTLMMLVSSLTSAFSTTSLALAAAVVYQLSSMVFAIQGIATIDFFMVRKNARRWLRILVGIGTYLILPMALTILGMLEQLFHVRAGYRLRDQMLRNHGTIQPPSQWPPLPPLEEDEEDTPSVPVNPDEADKQHPDDQDESNR